MWLAGAIGAGDHLLAEQHVGGVHDGAWLHRVEMPHTYELRPPWVSAMAQGEGASLLVRLYMATRDERYSEGARRALAAGRVPSRSGGASALLNGESFPEEYPTEPPSFVLNGAIFALWGSFDVGLGLGNSEASADFRARGEHAGSLHPPLGLRLLVLLRPVSAPRPQSREHRVPPPAHRPIEGDVPHLRAP